MYLGTITALQHLFTTNRGFATGFATIGVPLGILIHPLYTKYFLDLYGVSGVYMMQGAISLHIMIVTFAFKNPKPAAKKETKNNHHNELPEVSQPDVNTARNPENSATPIDKYHVIKSYLKGLLNFTLLQNICFVFGIFHFMLLWTIRLGIASQLVNCAMFRGIPDQQATYLLSMAGFVGLCMTVVSSITMKMSWLNLALFSGFAALCLSVSAFGCAFSQSYKGFVVSAVLMGIADGKNTSIFVLFE